MLALAMLGTSRTGRIGKVIAGSMAGLFGYVLVVTYWVKLIPLYAGFEDRTSLASVARLYRDHLSMLVERLNDVCLVPAVAILCFAAAISILAIGQQVILVKLLFERAGPDALEAAVPVAGRASGALRP